MPEQTNHPARPWRCPSCRYAVHQAVIGDRCSECGKALDVRSVRPAWAVGDGPARLQRAADLGLLGNLMLVVGFLVALLLLVFKATSIIIPFALVAAVSASFMFHWSATSRIGRIGLPDRSVARLRVMAPWRLTAAVTGAALLVASAWLAPIEMASNPWWQQRNVMILSFHLGLVVVSATIATSDIMLARRIDTIWRQWMLPPVWWHRPLMTAAFLGLAAVAVLSVTSVTNWFLALMGFGMVNAVTCTVLAIVSRQVRRFEFEQVA